MNDGCRWQRICYPHARSRRVCLEGVFRLGARDWGRESGRGFYSPIDRRVEIGPRMLMYGFDTGPSHWDIPDGMVESLFGYGDNPFITVNARVGADHIKKTNAEVYTK